MMAAITNLSIRRPVATAMVYLILVMVGVVSFRSLPVDLLPKVEFTQLSVRVTYPNVGPEEIEQLVTDPIENAVAGLANLRRVTSNSQEGRAWIRLEFVRGTNIDEAANDLRAALDRLRDDLPVEADPPEILKFDLDRAEVVSIAATSSRPMAELTRLLEHEIAQRFEQIRGVGTIDLRGGVYREIRIELDRDRLKASGLTALDVRDALARENVKLPGGNVKSGLQDLYVRALGEYRNLDEIARTVISHAGGHPIRVQDVATVRDDFEDASYLIEVNGVPAVHLGVQKQSGANTVAVAQAVTAEVERINSERKDIQLVVTADQSEFIQQSIDSVRTSALWGSLLAVLVLYLYLRNGSSTAIIAVSIPISVIASFGLLYFAGLTLNQMTFGGLALGVGMIIDSAIVVLESIVRKREETSATRVEAARAGTRDVAGAIIASTLTTCVVFLPVLFTRTTSGALFQALALVVVFALACSLFVALTLVPVLASRYLRVPSAEERQRSRTAILLGRLERWYSGHLGAAVERRRWVFGVTALLLIGAVLLWPLIPVELAPQTEADEVGVEMEMAEGTNIAVMRAYVDELEARVLEVLPDRDVDFSVVEVRGGSAEIELSMAPYGVRSQAGGELADKLRDALEGTLPGGELRVSAAPGLWILRRIFSSGGGDDAVEVELRGWDLGRADVVADDIRRRMESVRGVTDVRVSRREGVPEENLVFDRERISQLGLSVQQVARTVQANVGGLEAGRLRDGGNEYPIVVRLKPEDRLTADDLRGVALRTPAGAIVPLSSVVTRQRGRGPTRVQRVDGQRVTYVRANLQTGVALGDAVEGIQSALADLELPAEFSIYYGGEYEEQQQARRDFTIAILLALALVYMIMAAQFERFLDPLVVMLAVPVALVGVVPMLLLTGTTLNIQSVMGLVMLIGIVVNNAIVLVDTINLLRREHHLSVADAVIEAGRLRLRPILMTTTTTVLCLVPLALGLGPGAEIQAPLARVVIGGLTASMLVTLVLVPVAYVSAVGLTERVAALPWLQRRRARRDEASEDRPATVGPASR
jgi:hydrophobic/amphiphilic exporter-1 (mainly G- bacteria), HAE1 family